MSENNKVNITGEVVSIEFSHNVYCEEFYIVNVRTNSLATNIPCLVSKRLLNTVNESDKKTVLIIGELRSCYKRQNQLVVYVTELISLTNESKALNDNQVFLDGYIYNEPIYTNTETYFTMAICRGYGKTDYIPCVCQKDVNLNNIYEHIHVNGKIKGPDCTVIVENVTYF